MYAIEMPLSLIDVLVQMPNVGDDLDFERVNDQDEQDVFT